MYNLRVKFDNNFDNNFRLEVRDVPFKGRGVFNTKLFQKVC